MSETFNGGCILDTPEDIAFARLLTLRSMLKLEVAGLKHSRVSAYAILKRERGYRGSKASVLAQVSRDIDATFAARGAA